MPFFNIALNNIKKRFSSYMMYLISTIVSVTLFTLFCSLYFNPQFAKYNSGITKIGIVFKAAAIIIIIFSSVFVLYSNEFFLKKHKKEIAIYSLLGMRKSQIGSMLFFENIIMGFLATVCGIILGMVFSRFFAMILFKLMAAGTKVTFSVEIGAIVTPVVAFFILFTISSLNAYSIIYRNKLIDLLSASKKGEKAPKYSYFKGLLSIIFIAIGYIISQKIDTSLGMGRLLLPTFLMLVFIMTGTLMLFKNFVPMLMIKLKNNKHFYYKTSNFISISQIVYRIKANSTMLSMIAILCTATMVMTSGTYSMYHGLEDSITYYAPFSYMVKNISGKQYKNIVDTINQAGRVKITTEDKFSLIEAQVQNDKYTTQIENKPGKAVNGFILSESSYKSIIEATKAKKGSMSNIKTDFKGGLNDSQCYFIDGNINDTYCKYLKNNKVNVNLGAHKESFDIAGVSLHKYIGTTDLYLKPTIVVSDKVYDRFLKQADKDNVSNFTGFMFDKPMNSESTVNALNKIVPKRLEVPGVPNVSYIGYYKAVFSSFGVYTFIGMFLGILFMFAMGSIMYYKQIIEAEEEAPRYDILRKTGMNRTEVKNSISKQLGIVFGLPLIVGLSHTIFATLLYNRTMDVVGKETPTLLNAASVIAIFIVIYGIFYTVSVKSYMQIVWGKEE